ncbi:MAG: ATP-dependent protease LonB [DPANN group archaeon]|nr:ATP-dependent protease LonB [DPANN group archaeon]
MAKPTAPHEFKSTEEIKVPEHLSDQVLGQDQAVELIKKAAKQKRNVLLIGEPGVGKSLLAQAMAELLPTEKLEDILVYANETDKNNPKIKILNAGEGKKELEKEKKKGFQKNLDAMRPGANAFLLISLVFALSIALALHFKLFSDVILAAFIITSGFFMAVLLFASSFSQGMQQLRFGGGEENQVPKLLIDNNKKEKAPFIDATGARAGALLGDIRHDPYQSGGLGTPPHLRVEPGFIHRANKGVLFIDEIATLSPKSQQELLTAMQEKKYGITGQSEMSSGAMVRTEPVPCDFLLVASGNMVDLEKMHPALRSRIRGYGYEIYLNDVFDDSKENREKMAQFVAQEVKKDGKISHFTDAAVEFITQEARKRAGRKHKLTLKLRDLGGFIRAAGDIARLENSNVVEKKHAEQAQASAKTLEQQLADKTIDYKREYEVIKTTGYISGRVNGLAVLGALGGGIMLPIEAEVSPAQETNRGKTIATGKLGEIAKEAVQNVSAIIKKYKGKAIANHDIHIQFLQTHEGVEGDSAAVSIATAVISALERIPIDQSVAMTGSISIKGEVLPVGGVTAKTEAAITSGIRTIIVPEANKNDIVIDKDKLKKIKIVPAKDIIDVLEIALKKSPKKNQLIGIIKKIVRP